MVPLRVCLSRAKAESRVRRRGETEVHGKLLIPIITVGGPPLASYGIQRSTQWVVSRFQGFFGANSGDSTFSIYFLTSAHNFIYTTRIYVFTRICVFTFVQVVCISSSFLSLSAKELRPNQLFTQPPHMAHAHTHTQAQFSDMYKSPNCTVANTHFCTQNHTHVKRGLCLKGPRQLPADTQASDWWDAGGAGVDFVSCS